MKNLLSTILVLILVIYCCTTQASPGLTRFVAKGYCNNKLSFRRCRFNEGIEIRGISDGVFFNGSGNINPNEGTVEFWFLPKKKIQEYTSGSTLLHIKESFDENKISRIAIVIGNKRLELKLRIRDEKMSIKSSELEWDEKKPHHIAFTWGRNFIRFFLDGQNVGAAKYTNNLLGVKYDISLGGNIIRSVLNAPGVYDEFRVSDIERAKQEIKNSYTNNREFDLDKNTLLLAHFNNSIEAVGTVTEWKKANPKIYVDINGTQKVFFNNKEVYVFININNQTDRSAFLKIFCVIKGVGNSANFAGEKTETIEKRRSKLVGIHINMEIPYGYYEVKIVVNEGRQGISNLDTNIAVVRDLSGEVSDDSFFGLCSSGVDIIRNSKFISQLGFKWVSAKYVFYWHLIEPNKGIYNWDYADRVVMAAKESNINLLALIHGNPPLWVDSFSGIPENLGKKPRLIPDDEPHWRQYVSKINKRYKDTINYWEIWNEPDWWMTGKTYAQLLKAAFEEIKKIPSMKVVTGGFVVAIKNRKYPYKDFINEFKSHGGDRYYDILGFHLYGGYRNFLKYSRHLNRGKNKPVWITEWGLRLNKPSRKINKYDHAVKAMKTIIKSMCFGVKRFFWFYYTDLLSVNKEFGLMDSMKTPRPVLVAFNNIIHLLEGSKFIGNVSDTSEYVAYTFSKNDKKMAVVWCNRKECRVPIDKLSTRFTAYDVLGNVIEKNKLIVDKNFIRVSHSPIYFVIQ